MWALRTLLLLHSISSEVLLSACGAHEDTQTRSGITKCRHGLHKVIQKLTDLREEEEEETADIVCASFVSLNLVLCALNLVLVTKIVAL